MFSVVLWLVKYRSEQIIVMESSDTKSNWAYMWAIGSMIKKKTTLKPPHYYIPICHHLIKVYDLNISKN